MQPCIRCGWDTRSGSRLCAGCRAAEAGSRATQSNPDAEKEALLTAVLQSARAVDPLVSGDDPATSADHSAQAIETAEGEQQVVLREVEPGTAAEDDHIALDDVGAADDEDASPTRHGHDPSDVAASLVEALDRDDPGRPHDDAPESPETSKPDTNGGVLTGPGRDTAEDLAVLLNTPWDLAPATDPPPPTHDQPDDTHTTTPPPSPTYDTADDVLADVYEPQSLTTGDLANQAVDLSRDSTGSWDTDSRAKYSAEEWPWGDKSGEGGFWAPPADGRGTALDRHSRATMQRHGDPTGHGVRDPAADTGDDVAQRARGQESNEEPASGVQRLRALFQELGAWTALAQVALLAVGMLCIIQVFVLIVVSSYLSDARSQGGLAAGSLDAHAKVDGVMLPALLAFAVIAFAFAAWRSFAGRGSQAESGLLGRPLGLPMSLWFVLAAALVLLFVILADVPAAVPAAQRITQWAMFACALLGAACFAASRGLDTTGGD